MAGLAWPTFLAPAAAGVSVYVEVLGAVAEGALMLWLLVAGVDVHRWREQADRA